jgi:hypothetical protein
MCAIFVLPPSAQIPVSIAYSHLLWKEGPTGNLNAAFADGVLVRVRARPRVVVERCLRHRDDHVSVVVCYAARAEAGVVPSALRAMSLGLELERENVAYFAGALRCDADRGERDGKDKSDLTGEHVSSGVEERGSAKWKVVKGNEKRLEGEDEDEDEVRRRSETPVPYIRVRGAPRMPECVSLKLMHDVSQWQLRSRRRANPGRESSGRQR